LNSLVGIGSKIQVDGLEEQATVVVSRPQRGTQGGIIYPIWPGDSSRIPQKELERVVGEKDEWVLLLDLFCRSHVRDDSIVDVLTATVLFYCSRILSNA